MKRGRNIMYSPSIAKGLRALRVNKCIIPPFAFYTLELHCRLHFTPPPAPRCDEPIASTTRSDAVCSHLRKLDTAAMGGGQGGEGRVPKRRRGRHWHRRVTTTTTTTTTAPPHRRRRRRVTTGTGRPGGLASRVVTRSSVQTLSAQSCEDSDCS